MLFEQYSNDTFTTLNGAIASGDTTLIVTSAAGFPSIGNFRLRIDTELLIVTSVSGATFTVSRGTEGTTAAAHSSGATVEHVLSRDGLQALIAKGIVTDAYANRPAAGLNGRIFWPNDSYQIEYDNGSIWTPWGPIWKFNAPNIGDFSWFNQTSNSVTASYDTSLGGILINAPAQAGGESPRGLEIVTPATPYTITMFLMGWAYPENYFSIGGYWRDSSGGRQVRVGMAGYSSGGNWGVSKNNSDNSFDSVYISGVVTDFAAGPWQWIQMSDNGTNRIIRASWDGRRWIAMHSVGRTDWMTANRVGFFANSINPTHDCNVLCLSWAIT